MNKLDEIVQQFIASKLEEQNPDLDEILKKYPDLAEKIRQRIRNFEKINNLFAELTGNEEKDNLEHQLIGQKLGDFEILELIGTGGMGAVFLAKQISLDRQVALKVISDARGIRSRTLERFKREANLLAKISHPNIVPIYEVGQHGPYSYFAMEYVNGISLSDILTNIRISNPNINASVIFSNFVKSKNVTHINVSQSKQETPVPVIDKEYIQTISRIIIDIASALDHVHNQGILHRDIKPSNILIDTTGKAKLVDFGLANSETTQSITITGELFGTPNYMPPEQIQYPDKVDKRSDIYSLGATYYECLTFHTPFEGATINEILTKIISKEVPPPRKYCSKLSKDLDTILLHTLKKNPADRYNSALEFVNDIRNALDFKPIIARRTSLTLRTYKTIRRNPVKTAIGFLILCLICTCFALVYYNRKKEDEAHKLVYVNQLLDEADILLCQAALNMLPWPLLGREPLTEMAIKYYDEVLQIDNRNWWALIQRGIACLVSGENIERALKDFENAEKINPGFKGIQYLRSMALKQNYGNVEGSISLNNREALSSREAYILGLLICQQPDISEREQKSLSLFEICLEKEPGFYPAMLARIFVKNGIPGENNLDECLAVSNLKPNVAFGHLLCGNILGTDFGKFEEAIVEYKKSVNLQPWNPLCYSSMGLLYETIGDTDNAEKCYLKAQELDVSCFTNVVLAWFYISQYGYPKSLDVCNEGISKKCNLISLDLLLDAKLFILKESDSAVKLFRLFPQLLWAKLTADTSFTMHIQACLAEKEDCLKKLLLEVEGNQNLSREYHVKYLNFLLNNNRIAEAKTLYDEVLINKPQFKYCFGGALIEYYRLIGDDTECMNLCQSLYERMLIEGFNDILDFNDRGVIVFVIIKNLIELKLKSGDTIINVEKLCKDVLDKFPQDSDLWEYYGMFHDNYAQDYAKASEAYRQALRYLQDEKDRFRITFGLAMALHRAGNDIDAEKEFNALIYKLDKMEIINRENSWRYSERKDIADKYAVQSIYTDLSDMYLVKKDYLKAINVLEKGLKRLPKHFEIYRKKAIVHLSMGDKNKAIQSYFRYFDTLPFNMRGSWPPDQTRIGDTIIALTTLLIEEKQLDKAEEFIKQEQNHNRKVPALNTPWPYYETSLCISRAKLNFARNNFDNGINELNKALEIQPESTLIWGELENAYISKGFYQKAKETAEYAIKLNPKQNTGYLWLSIVYRYLKDYDKAINVLKQYLLKNPNDATIQKNLDIIYSELEHYKELGKH